MNLGRNRSGKKAVNVAVIVASVNRGEEVGQLLVQLNRQTLRPATIILSVERQEDLPGAVDPRVQIIMGRKGLTVQRNRGLDGLQDGADGVVL